MNTARKIIKTIRQTTTVLLMLLVSQVIQAQTNPDPTTLLVDRFGVVLQLQAPHDGGSFYSYDWSSFQPTKNTETADWIESDWYGNWSPSSYNYMGINHESFDGSDDDWYPSGGEIYDTEAYYFDNDKDYLYIVVVSSIPHLYFYPSINESGVGVYDPRTQGWVRPGDLSLNLQKGDPHAERYNKPWYYNYGVDLVHENRDNFTTYGSVLSASMRDDILGNKLYKTQYNTGGGDATTYPVNPYRLPENSDWYVSSPITAVPGHWELTNFDPFSTISQSLGISLTGEVETRYYEITWEDEQGNPLLENNAPTFAIEIKIPRAILGEDNPAAGDMVGIQWVEGCRNDGNNTAGSWLEGDVDDSEWDVGVAKTSSIQNPGVNSLVDFTITVTNFSEEPVNDVVVKDLLPAGLLYSDYSADQGTYNHSTGIWTVGTIPAGESFHLTITVTLLIANEVCNGVTLEDYDHFDHDADLSNNQDEACVDSDDKQVDLGVTKTVYNAVVQAGQQSVFTIQVTNYGQIYAAHNVVIEDILDSNFTYVSSIASKGQYDPETGHWTIPVIEPQAQEQLEITVISQGSADNLARLIELDETDVSPKNNEDLVSVTVSGSSGGNDGGLESDGTLASLIARRNFNRAKESKLNVMNTREMIPSFSEDLAQNEIIVAAGKTKGGFNLAELLSENGPYNSTGFVTTPDDLLGISNASQVFSVDYFSANDKRMGAILAIATEGEVYNHTKMICDRLMGATMDLIHTVSIHNQSFILGKLVQPDGSVDYAISFIAQTDNGSWKIDNRWHNEEYQTDPTESVFNFQVWSVTSQSTVEMVEELLNRLEDIMPLLFNNRETPKSPAVYVRNGYYANGMLNLNLHNIKGNNQITIKGTLTRNEHSAREPFQFSMPLSSDQENQTVAIPTGYIFDVDFSMANPVDANRDALYYADGSWGSDFETQGAIIDDFVVETSQGTNFDDAFILERDAHLSGSVRSYASLFRALKPGNIPVDLTGYGQIQFEASGIGTVEMIISKASIDSWSNQFKTAFTLGSEWETYTIDLSQLVSKNHTAFTPEDVLNVVFNALGDGSNFIDFEINIRNLRFKKGSSDLPTQPNESAGLRNYPNPFKDFTTLHFNMPDETNVQIALYNLQGQEIRVLANRVFNAGENQIELDLRDLEQGIYIVKLSSDLFFNTHRLNLVR